MYPVEAVRDDGEELQGPRRFNGSRRPSRFVMDQTKMRATIRAGDASTRVSETSGAMEAGWTTSGAALHATACDYL